MKINALEERIVSKIFLQSLGVYILSDIAQTAGPLVDAIVTAGWLGVDAVAANALVMPTIMLLIFLATMLAGGLEKRVHRTSRQRQARRSQFCLHAGRHCCRCLVRNNDRSGYRVLL